MKLYKNGLIILLSICLVGTIAFYRVRNNTQINLNKRITHSLELNGEAAELLARKEFEEARELLKESLSLNRHNAETHVYLAFVEFNLGNNQQAYEHFVSGLNMEATSVDMIKHLADILINNGYYSEAGKYLTDGLKDFPDNEDLLFLLGKTALLNSNYISSIKTFENLLGKNDAYLEGYKYLGMSYYFFGDRESAAVSYREYLMRRGLLDEEENPAVDELHDKVLEVWGENYG